MIAYCDTSALLKVFVEESDSERMVEWLLEADQVACSCVGLVEALAAFARRRAAGHLTVEGAITAGERFRETWRSVAVVDLDVDAAASLAMTHGLRSLDAIHLAAALSLAEHLAPLLVVVATFDRQMARVARDVGLTVWP